MSRPMIRFSCACGKSLSADAKHAGRSTHCPRCKRKVEVPAAPAAEEPARVSREPAGPCRHPRLDAFYAGILASLGDSIDHHEVDEGRPSVRLTLPDHRRQAIRLDVQKDEKGRERLVVESEVGTVTSFEETVKALRMNRSLGQARLVLDDAQVLLVEARVRLDEVGEADVLQLVDRVSRKADELEAALFGVDIR